MNKKFKEEAALMVALFSGFISVMTCCMVYNMAGLGEGLFWLVATAIFGIAAFAFGGTAFVVLTIWMRYYPASFEVMRRTVQRKVYRFTEAMLG